jgi:hypothetical protein
VLHFPGENRMQQAIDAITITAVKTMQKIHGLHNTVLYYFKKMIQEWDQGNDSIILALPREVLWEYGWHAGPLDLAQLSLPGRW